MPPLESVLPSLTLLYSSVMIKNYPFLGEVVGGNGDNGWLII
jgi:hypothetical protein